MSVSEEKTNEEGKPTNNEETQQYLSFILGDEEYGLEILRVQEIKGWEKTTYVPKMPNYVKGVINLRGSVVPVIDLRIRFDLPEIKYDTSTVVIIVKSIATNGDEKIVGIVVDGVSDVHSMQKNQLQPAPEIQGTIHSDFIVGLSTVEEKMVIILDIDELVNHGVMRELKKHLDLQVA